MDRPPFLLKPIASLTEADFETSPLWAGYYEPDDLDEIIRWGIPEASARKALDQIGWEDDHYFPLPVEAAASEWMRGKFYAATVTDVQGRVFMGFVGENRDWVTVFTEQENCTLSSRLPECNPPLMRAVSPYAVCNLVTGETWSFSIPS